MSPSSTAPAWPGTRRSPTCGRSTSSPANSSPNWPPCGHPVAPGELGENVTTYGVDLLALPTGALLRLGPEAVVEVTGLRNPCLQLDAFQEGLLRRVVGRAPDGSVVRRAGIMGVVRTGGTLRPGDPVGVELPAGEHRPLEPV